MMASWPGGARAGDSPGVADLLASAREARLHEERYWHILLHYEKTLTGFESQVDDPKFFAAATGKTDPEAELAATIRLLFGREALESDAVCRFYARFKWLEEQLGDRYGAFFAGKGCPRIDAIEPRRASLIFPTYYMNNPASIFGHTLLIIDTAYTSRRLSNAVNFAAYTEGYDGMMLAFNGLTGRFKGYYSVTPYYEKIAEYSDINQRDIWEYELNLTPDELRRMIRHIREFEGIYTDYYFFDENCSYSILYMIEAARPSVRLADRFPFWAIPIDTVKAVKSEGLIANVAYRPAKATRIDHLFDAMSPGEAEAVLAIVREETAPDAFLAEKFPDDAGIRVLDLAVEIIQYRFINGEIEKGAYRRQVLAALKARSRLGRAAADPVDDIPVPPHPEEGHDSRRFSVGAGLREGDVYYEWRGRAALTDLTDADHIHYQGAQIELGEIRGRYYPEDGNLKLQQFDILDIVSLSPVDTFFKPISWRGRTGWDRKPAAGDADALYYLATVGAGYAARAPHLGLIYALAEAEADIGDDFRADYAVGGGGSAGVILEAGKDGRVHLYGRVLRFFAGGDHTHFQAGATAAYRVRRNHQAAIEFEWEAVSPQKRYDIQALWHIFF